MLLALNKNRGSVYSGRITIEVPERYNRGIKNTQSFVIGSLAGVFKRKWNCGSGELYGLRI